LATQLFEEAIPRYGLVASELTVHHDRGAPMTSHTFKDLLADLQSGEIPYVRKVEDLVLAD